MSSKGQIVVPVELRRRADLRTGDRLIVDFDEEAKELRMRKAASVDQVIDQLSRLVASWVRPNTEPLEDPRTFYRTREPRH